MNRYSYEYGPLLFAVAGPIDNGDSIWIHHDPEDFRNWILSTDESLTFSIKGDSVHKLEPYFRLDDKTPMTCFPVFSDPESTYC